MDAILNIFIPLINSMSVVIVVAYVLTRTAFFGEVLDGRLTGKNKAYLIVFFGCFSVYGTVSGVDILGAVANARYIGPVVAGLVGGPLVGFGAGLIGGVHRYVLGGFTYFASSLSTLVAGLAAGLIFTCRKRRKKGFIGVLEATLLAFAIQVYHLGQILMIEQPFEKASALVENVAGPMILTNSAGVAIFAFIIANHIKENKTCAERDKYLRENERIESELTVASDIQNSMVPTVFTLFPERPEFDLHATLKPAKEVGGDLYDFAMVDAENLYFAVGDVSDKGVPAALLMAVTKTLLKSTADLDQPPDKILAGANAELSSRNEALMFVTVFCGKINCRTGELVYSNAGHNPPFIVRTTGEVEKLTLPDGLVLGVDPKSRYTSSRILLHPGDALIAYTDGVTEAMNAERKLFSEARLIEAAGKCARDDAKGMVNRIADSVNEYAAGAVQSDDITIMAIRYVGCSGSRI